MEKKTVKVKALKGFVVSPGKTCKPGDIVELPAAVAAGVINSKKAEVYAGK